MALSAISTVGVSPVDAQRERIRREQARRDVIDYGEYVAPWWTAARHHRLVGEYLMEVVRYLKTDGREGINRLMVFEPPRHGKTAEVSEIFTSFLLGIMPNTRIILACYNEALAARSSRAAREYVSGDRFANLFGGRSCLDVEDEVRLSNDTRSKTDWDLGAPHRGGFIARGIGGGLTGHGANVLIIDDPFKDRGEADSDAVRESIWAWYSSTAITRLEKISAVIVMHTRWHEDDLAGRLLRAMGSDDPLVDQWTVLDLPARAWGPTELATSKEEQRVALLEGVYKDTRDALDRPEGAALWPEKASEDDLAKREANSIDIDWASLYMQRPSPPQGEMFNPDAFIIEPRAPENLKWFRYADLALGKKRTSDWNSCLAVAIASEADVWYRDMIRARKWEDFKKELKTWMLSPMERGTLWIIESTGFQTLAFREFVNDPELISVRITDYQPDDDKVADARILQTRVNAGKAHLVDGPWVQRFKKEIRVFPRGKNDDQVDTATRGLKYAVRGRRSGIHA